MQLALLKQRVDSLWETINGGPNVEWKQSVRGRLHEMADFVQASRNLELATRNIKRSARQRLDTWAQVVLVLCALGALATPYILHFA